MKTVHISKYLTFLQGIKNEFVSNYFFVIGVLMILVIIRITYWMSQRLYSEVEALFKPPPPPDPRVQVRLNKSCTWLDCEETLTSCGISQRIKGHIIKIQMPNSGLEAGKWVKLGYTALKCDHLSIHATCVQHSGSCCQSSSCQGLSHQVLTLYFLMNWILL